LVGFLQIYRNSIGDISPPAYGRWTELANSDDPKKQRKANIMIALVWLTWVTHQFTVLIILLNFLIAIVSQSYENVMQKLEIFKYKVRVDFNVECLQVMDYFGLLEPIDTLIVIAQDEDTLDGNEWSGMINSIRSFVTHGF